MMFRLQGQRWGWVMLALGFALGMFGALAAGTSAQEVEGRTQYESYELDTPDIAVQTFAYTFHQRDYAGLYLLFAPQTQMAWNATFNTLNFDRIIAPEAVDALHDELTFGFNHTQTEHSPQLADYLFDEVMLIAEAHNAFPIDLRGDLQVLRSENNTIPAYRQAESTDQDDTPLPVVDVITSVEGIEGEVTFRMVPSPSQRWQVLQVIVPGGNEDITPWSIVAKEE